MILTRRATHASVLTRSITTNAPKITRIEDPHKKHNYQSNLRKQINRRVEENLPFPSRVAKKFAWDTKDFVPIRLNEKDTTLFVNKKYGAIANVDKAKERVKNAEERLGTTLPEEYKYFLEQLEQSEGVRNPAHIWSKNKMLLDSEEGDALDTLYFANELEPIGSLLERWNTNLGAQEAHEWQKYPAVLIGIYGHLSLVLFLSDHQQFKKGSVYVYKSGVFDQLRLVSDSFSEFANSFFTVDEEEEYQEFIEKIKLRTDEKKRFKRLYNPKKFEYEGTPGPSINHRYQVNQEAKKQESNKTTKGKVAEKYEWEEWEWKKMMIGDRYTRLDIFEDQQPGLSPVELAELEKYLNLTLPADYKKFLAQYNGVSVKKPSHVWNLDGFVAFDDAISYLYGFDKIEKVAKLVEEKKIENSKYTNLPAIAIAGDNNTPKVFMFLQDYSFGGKDFKAGHVWTFLQNNEKNKDEVNLIAESFNEYCDNFLSDAEEEVYEANKNKK